jgi:hypothetical protein
VVHLERQEATLAQLELAAWSSHNITDESTALNASTTQLA